MPKPVKTKKGSSAHAPGSEAVIAKLVKEAMRVLHHDADYDHESTNWEIERLTERFRKVLQPQNH